MRIAVIGAGMAGLAAARNCLAFGVDVIVYEQTKQIGGTWILTDRIGKDENGLDVHTSMYEGLRTNLPKESMCYPNFPFPEQEKSYITSQDVLDYFELYADQYKLKELIKFEHYVIRVLPLGESQWQIIVKDLPNNSVLTEIFDGVLVCNGHYFEPNLPKLEGRDIFCGKQLHSHDYRNAETFKDEKILVIGAGPTGIDLAIDLNKIAKNVTISNHVLTETFVPSLNKKPDVRRLTENGAEFCDGTAEPFSMILYCTGYKYSFPFLSTDCDITVDDNYVHPLYKHCLNVNWPTMGIIGIPIAVCCAQLFDLQSRFCLTFFTGKKKLPSRTEMLNDIQQDMNKRWASNNTGSKSKSHKMRELQQEYYDSMAELAGIETIKPVFAKMELEGSKRGHSDFENFRNDIYKIIDDENFVRN